MKEIKSLLEGNNIREAIIGKEKEVERTEEVIQAEIDALDKEIDEFEIDPDDYEDSYIEALNSEGEIHIGSLTFDPADIVREMDPTAYRIGLNDYVDSMGDKESDNKYQELADRKEELEQELADLMD